MNIANMPLSAYRIVYPADALSGLVSAARVLAEIAEATLGVDLPVGDDTSPAADCEILLGVTNRDTAKVAAARAAVTNDGFAILTQGSHLYVTAPTVRGTVYGIYAVMEDCLGARFCSSRCRVLHPERVRDIPADLCRIENPAFMSRDTFWFDVLEPARDSAHDYPCACRSNHGEMPHVGGGVSYAGGFVHTFPALAGTAHEPGVQPCLTDEGVFETVRANVRRWLDENPAAKIISVSQNDSYAEQLGCQCEKCRAIDEREGTPMGSLLTFVNRIADDIRDDYPDVWVDTLAYRYTRKAPKTLRPADNVIIRLCSIECCFSHPLADPDCPHNAAFVRDIEEWSALCSHLYIWDYTTDFLCYLSPFPNFGVLRQNVKFFKDHSVIGLFEQGNYQSLSGEFGELRAYLLSKLLWDPDMTEESYYALMDGFLADYYGPGWRAIRRYIDETTALAATRHLHIYDWPNDILPAAKGEASALAAHYVSLWDEALAAASNAEEAAHVRQSRVQALYYATFTPDYPASTLAEMHDAIRASGITHFREGGPVPAALDPDDLPDLH